MVAKKCFRCKKIKNLSEFYRHSLAADGHLGKCIECTKVDAWQYRQRNLERLRARDRERYKLPHRIAARRITYRKHATKYQKLHPLEYIAGYLLRSAVRDKRVMKPDKCSECGATGRIHGHHEDYYEPLNVIWLCALCHAKRTKYNGYRG